MSSVPHFEQKKVISLFTVLAYLGAALLGLWLLYALRALLLPFLVATIIAMTLTPEIDFWERRGMKRGVAIGIIYVLFLTIFSLVLAVLIPHVTDQMSGLLSNLAPQAILHIEPEQAAEKFINTYHIPAMLQSPIRTQAQHLPEMLNQGILWIRDNLPTLAENLVWVVIVPIIAFFILLDFHKIFGKLLILVPESRRADMFEIVTEIIAVFGSWIRGVLLVMSMDIVVSGLVLWGAGLQSFALTLAVVAGVLYTIPYFGAIVSTLLIGLVTLAVHGWVVALIVTVIMIIIHQVIFDNIIAPRVIGGSVNLHPLLTLIALMAGGTLFGLPGTLLAVPIAAAIQIIMIQLFPQFKTDVVSVHRLSHSIQTEIAEETEKANPPARKEGDGDQLGKEADEAREEAANAPIALPSGRS